MSISFINSGAASATSVAVSGNHYGDVLLVFAYRSASATPPTLAAGYTSIASSGGNVNSSILAYKYSDGTETTSGTWANATQVICHVYRGCDVASNGPCGGNAAGGASSTSIAYNTLTMTRSDGTSWIVGFAGA